MYIDIINNKNIINIFANIANIRIPQLKIDILDIDTLKCFFISD